MQIKVNFRESKTNNHWIVVWLAGNKEKAPEGAFFSI
jgi:hypothetical protein